MAFQKEREALERVVREAGATIHRMAADGFETAHKANQDPVTTADLAADAILKQGLLGAFPETGWLSEETRDHPERLEKTRVWIVDPIDGTKEFVSGIPEYAVSVALVEHGKPVLGAVYNPAKEEFYLAVRGEGVWLNGGRIEADRPLNGKPVILASRSEVKRGEFAPFEDDCEVVICGSIAYKLALLGAAKADTTFSLGPKNEWDIAAGCLIIEEAGGCVGDRDMAPFTFNQPKTLVSGIIATTKSSHARVLGRIREVLAAGFPPRR